MRILVEKIIAGLRGLANGLMVTLRNNFRKKSTIQYGFAPRWSKQEQRPIAPRFRGKFVLLRNKGDGELRCTGCKMCAIACPGRCITVNGENKHVTDYQLELDRCLFCGLCVEACPFEALGMVQQGVEITKDHQTLSLNLEDLAETPETPPAAVLPSTVGGDLRPGKKPFVEKSAAPAATQEGGAAQ